jgi:Flp pilus assembly protein TadD
MGSKPILAAQNLFAAGYGVLFYMAKFICPVNLSAYYPYPANLSIIWLALPTGLVILIILVRKFREIFFSQTFFLIAVLPVIKLIPFGDHVAADRFIYFPSLGFFFLLGWVLSHLWGKTFAADKFKKGIVALTAVLFLATLLGTSRDRLQVWQDSGKLWKSVIERYPGIALAHTNLGYYYAQQGRMEESISEYKKALTLYPEDASTLNNLGNAYRRIGLFDEAIRAYKKALEIKPRYAPAYTNLGVAYEQQEMLDEAISAHLNALAIDPQNSLAHTNLGVVYMRRGMLGKAIEEHRRAIALDPSHALAYANLGAAYGKQGMLDEAISEFKKALTIDPNYAKVHYNLGVAYQIKKEMNLAEYHFERAFSLGYKASAQVLEMLRLQR